MNNEGMPIHGEVSAGAGGMNGDDAPRDLYGPALVTLRSVGRWRIEKVEQ